MPTSYLQKLKVETDTFHHCSSLSALPESATSTSAGLDFRSVAGGTDGRGTVRDEEGPFWTGKLFDELARRWSSALRASALPTASESTELGQLKTHRRLSASARAPPGNWLYPDSMSWGADEGIRCNLVATLKIVFPSVDTGALPVC